MNSKTKKLAFLLLFNKQSMHPFSYLKIDCKLFVEQ